VHWETEVLEELCEMLRDVAQESQFLWNNQVLVHLMVPGQRDPWASLHTKRAAALELVLAGPKGRFALGRVTELAAERELETGRAERDLVKLRFRTAADLARGDLKSFLQEHLSAVSNGL
jgi:excinuclease ABC subunit A